jgi:hypothetical protein
MAAVSGPGDDPVLKRREQIRRLCDLGQKVGYGLFGLAILLFVVGFVAGFPGAIVTVIVACLVVGSAVLAPAIVFSYAVKAAEKDEAAGS